MFWPLLCPSSASDWLAPTATTLLEEELVVSEPAPLSPALPTAKKMDAVGFCGDGWRERTVRSEDLCLTV